MVAHLWRGAVLRPDPLHTGRPAMRLNMLKRALRAGMLCVALAAPAGAQWSTVSEQYYLPASHNWVFRREHPVADRLFNAFDYGHAILYEVFWARPSAPVSVLESDEYTFITRRL